MIKINSFIGFCLCSWVLSCTDAVKVIMANFPAFTGTAKPLESAPPCSISGQWRGGAERIRVEPPMFHKLAG